MIYFVRAAQSVKIGVVGSAKYMDDRLRKLQCGSSIPLVVLGIMEGDFTAEKALHDRFSEQRYLYEWFHLTPDIVNFIETNCRPFVAMTNRSNLVPFPKKVKAPNRQRIGPSEKTRKVVPIVRLGELDRDALVQSFISDCLVPGGKCGATDLHKKLARYCRKQMPDIPDVNVPSQKILAVFLQNAGFESFKKKTIFWRVTVRLPQDGEVLDEPALAG